MVQTLVPQVLSLKIFTILLDSSAAEHAARTIAMQMATDNATALLQELKIQYNKSRQQAITNELLDMMGGETAANYSVRRPETALIHSHPSTAALITRPTFSIYSHL